MKPPEALRLEKFSEGRWEPVTLFVAGEPVLEQLEAELLRALTEGDAAKLDERTEPGSYRLRRPGNLLSGPPKSTIYFQVHRPGGLAVVE